jgi:hypothetical protein
MSKRICTLDSSVLVAQIQAYQTIILAELNSGNPVKVGEKSNVSFMSQEEIDLKVAKQLRFHIYNVAGSTGEISHGSLCEYYAEQGMSSWDVKEICKLARKLGFITARNHEGDWWYQYYCG